MRLESPQQLPESEKMKTLMSRLWQEDRGQDLSEYGLLLVLVAVAAAAAVGKVGTALKTLFSTAASNVTAS